MDGSTKPLQKNGAARRSPVSLPYNNIAEMDATSHHEITFVLLKI